MSEVSESFGWLESVPREAGPGAAAHLDGLLERGHGAGEVAQGGVGQLLALQLLLHGLLAARRDAALLLVGVALLHVDHAHVLDALLRVLVHLHLPTGLTYSGFEKYLHQNLRCVLFLSDLKY